MTDAQFAVLVGLLERVAQAVERGAATSPTPPAVPPAAADLLRLIFQHVKGRSFTAISLVDFVDAARADELAVAITSACGALSARRLGKLLAAIQGAPADGYAVRRVGNSREGICWQVHVCASLKHATPARLPDAA
jgi:hypothetical protein